MLWVSIPIAIPMPIRTYTNCEMRPFRNARTPFGAHRFGAFSLGGMAPELDASPPPEAAIKRKIQLETNRIWICDSFLLKVSLN